ncbi:MAG: EamA family transporter [Desulfobacteraceae bacterium 4572_130]|nr:MAG: EamA family transporter [Desulfobacteraceae bacterium 4572_130]
MKNTILYLTTIFIWGSTWLAIKFQLGHVDPIVSILYRFFLAGFLLLAFCIITKQRMEFLFKEHLCMALQGLFLFSLNYWAVYTAETYMTSGLVAVAFSLIVFLNITNGYIFLRTPLNSGTLIGAILGTSGIYLIFMPEISSFDLSDKNIIGICLGFTGVFLASLGNIISARNQKNKLPVLQTNAYGMAYGAIIMFIIAFSLKKNFNFLLTYEYIGSLFYLSVFGSIIAFGCYLTLIGNIGADRASYAIMLIQPVALCFSTFFEGYTWTRNGFLGLILIMAGNLMILKKKSRKNIKRIFKLSS